MLNYFPTPYPDEWWYSLLCRFYLSSGISVHSVVKEQLFGSEYAAMGTLYPNGAMSRVIRQLPENLFRFEEILKNNTLFNYFSRLYPEEERNYMIRYLSEGGSLQVSHAWKAESRKGFSPRYCPLCMKDDFEKFGECYYHVSHQLPSSMVCLEHKCRLKKIHIPDFRGALDEKFYPLQLQDTDSSEDYEYPEYEYRISILASEYQNLKSAYKNNMSANCLYQELLNNGYGKIDAKQGHIIDREKLYLALSERYPEESIKRIYGDKISRGTMNHIRKLDYLVPERYIFLQDLVGVTVKDMLIGSIPEDRMKNDIEKMIHDNGFITVKEIALKLRKKEYEIKALIKEYGIVLNADNEAYYQDIQHKTERMQFYLTETEMIEVREEARRMGFRSVGSYVYSCMKYVMQERKKR